MVFCTVCSSLGSNLYERSRAISSASRSARCTRQNCPPLRSRYAAAPHSSASVHVSSDRAVPRCPAAAAPLPAAK